MSAPSPFKARLKDGHPLLGCFVKTPSPVIVEVLAGAGLDCVCLDAEHAPFDRRDLDLCLMAARAHGLPALVRVASGAASEVLNALDLGATGIVFPHIRNAEQAEAAVRACHFGAGGRGYAGGTRSAGFGAPPIGDRLVAARAETCVIAQIEDADALPEAKAICAVDGLDAVFIGRIDLTVALGAVDPKDPAVLEVVRGLCATARHAGMPIGMFTPDPGEVPAWRDHGASLFLLGSDQGFVKAGAVRLRQDSGL